MTITIEYDIPQRKWIYTETIALSSGESMRFSLPMDERSSENMSLFRARSLEAIAKTVNARYKARHATV